MSFITVSDIHITSSADPMYSLLIEILQHSATQKSQDIYLLGDIFDLMYGPKNFYIQQYRAFFDECYKLLQNGKKIYYFEGNHDLQLSGLFELYCQKHQPEILHIQICKTPLIQEYYGESIYFSHGDEISAELSYRLYKKILNGPLVRGIGHFIKGEHIQFIGDNLSQLSKSLHKQRQYDFTEIRIKYRKAILKMLKQNYCNKAFIGHNHIFEKTHFKKNYAIFNNGLFQTHRSFFFYQDPNNVQTIFL